MSTTPPRQEAAAVLVDLELTLDPCVNFALQQNAVAPLKELGLVNTSASELRDVLVRIRAEPEFMLPLEHRIATLTPGQKYVTRALALELLPRFLAGLEERLDGLLHVEVFASGERVGGAERRIALLAYDQWGGLRVLPELLSAFVLPNHPAVASWLGEAAALLEKWTGNPSLSGYQSNSRERVAKSAAAVFHALQGAGPTYIDPPASFEREGQKIRTPDRIAQERMGTCLDFAVLAAACLEQSGLHPLIVAVEGHAFAGVWLEETMFPDAVIEDAALLAKRVELGEILVFDPTLTTSRPAASFDDAVAAAREHFRRPDKFHAVIDVTRCRKGGVRPLPMRASGVDLPGNGPSRPASPDQAPTVALPGAANVPATVETTASRIERWKRRLLDLTARNRLLNFRETKKTIAVAHAQLGELEDVLAEGRTLVLRPQLGEMGAPAHGARPVDPRALEQLVRDELSAGRLVTQLAPETLETRLLEIYRAAREGLEEGGASGLYLALGFVEWFEDSTSTQPRRAPLVLVPVDLERGSIRQGYRLARGADETRFNTTLLEMLRVQHGVTIVGLEPLPQDAHGVDVDVVLQRVRAAIRDTPRWRVLDEGRLGFFTFAKFLMWKDLEEQADVLLQNRIVAHLAQRPDDDFDPELRGFEDEDLDHTTRAAELFCPVPADSSQLAAVVAAARGKSFVLEGPPGTGKSQTITNLIAHCLASGKTVLFVSEKTAALNVVFERLKRIGLERFCLELHSNKASKLKVVQDLGRALGAAQVRAPEEWAAVAGELDELRAELNKYARAMARVHANGLSAYRAVSLSTELRGVPALDLGLADVSTLDRSTLERMRAHLRDAQSALRTTGAPCGHPLDGAQIVDVPAGLQERIARSFTALRNASNALVEVGTAPGARLGLDLTTASWRSLALLGVGCDLVRTAPPRGVRLLALTAADAERLVREACATGRRRAELRAMIEPSCDLRLLEFDLLALRGRAREAAAAWAMPRWWKTRNLRKALAGVTRADHRPTLGEIQLFIDQALELRDIEAALARALAALESGTGVAWRIEEAPWDEIDELLAWTRRAREALQNTDLERAATAWLASDRGACESAARVVERIAVLDAASAKVAALLRLATGNEWHATDAPGRLAAWHARMARIEPELGRLKSWALWQRLRQRLVDDQLTALVSAVEQGRTDAGQLQRCFDRSFYDAWLVWVRNQTPVLRDFLGESHDQRIARFQELDQKCTDLARRMIAARLSANAPALRGGAVPGSELGVLQRQVQLQRRHMGLRQLFQQTRTLVQRLKPCFLMSPISVAQYLPPGRMAFDIVVFDEASQIPTWDAVGALARGAQAVIVGDSKQLPPTSFFDAVVGEEEADEGSIEDLESILDECRAASIPPLDLRWHYRSRHESLITFSNRKYYESRLHTFPAAHTEGLGVQWRHIAGGVYDKGRSRTNRCEAEALVAEILARLRDPARVRHSVGAVTFSAAQQTLVEDLLDAERRADPTLDRFFIASEEVPEPVFVKNLENVQGDERDVILFSICYGPDEQGRVSMNFGPLNQQGGQRRLNVAVTRARRELIVFSTLTADQIDLSRTRAAGVADLRTFLSYAQHGIAALPAETSVVEESDDFDSPLEREVCAALRARGYAVHTQVGCSGYRIDLGVVHPDAPGRYLVGIECDGRNYHSARTARDRDRLRQSVLEGLGWTLIRVWSSDWWEEKEQQIARLCARIEEVRMTPTAAIAPARSAQTCSASEQGTDPCAEDADTSIVAESAVSPGLAGLPKYQRYEPARMRSQEAFYDERQQRAVESVLVEVVEAEGPLLLELAASRVAAAFGFARTRRPAVERVAELAQRRGLPRTTHGARVFLWPESLAPASWRGFRLSNPDDDGLRAAEELPPEEIANAAEHLVATNGACPRRDLLRALARMFGFKALGSSVASSLEQGLELWTRSGRARMTDGDTIEEIS
jgi:very-short-patch-repair endonuclease